MRQKKEVSNPAVVPKEASGKKERAPGQNRGRQVTTRAQHFKIHSLDLQF